jgi:ABC-2 type transport system permease protein
MRSRSVALAVAWRSLHNFFTNPTLVIPSLLFPLFFFTAFAGGLSSIGNAPGFDFPDGYTAFQFVFVLLQSSAFGGVFTGFAIARDFESGFGRRLMLAAPRRSAIVAGYALAALGRAMFVWVLLTAIALAVGMQVSGNAVELAGLYLLAAVMCLAAVLWAAGIALRFRTMQAGPLMQTPVFLILFLAPVYVPIDLLHGWVKVVAGVNPITAIVEAGRNFISGSPVDVLLAYGTGLGLVLLFSVWALTGLRRAEAAGG